MKILTFSTLYPNAARPSHGVFVENRLRHLVASGMVEARVLAPVPWFPFRHRRFGAYADFAATPRRERRYGLTIDHPRYVVVPKLGMTMAPYALYRTARKAARRMREVGGDFDLIDAHYFYPDGVAAVMLALDLGKPVTITARGTDLNLIPDHALPRRMIKWAAREADGLITVCQALKDVLGDLGVDPARVTVLRNGVDLETFRPVDRVAARRRLGLEGPTLASVGYLIPRKANELIIGALPALPDFSLIIAGDGPEEAALKALAGKLGVTQRVHFLGRVAHENLREIYGAADALVLASSREGWPNVLLEAMACGTPAVASRVWGSPEVVAAPEAGVLMAERTEEGVAAAVKALFAASPDRAATRAYAEGFSWRATTEGQIALFNRILDQGAIPASPSNDSLRPGAQPGSTTGPTSMVSP